jgi:hypothetical protein
MLYPLKFFPQLKTSLLMLRAKLCWEPQEMWIILTYSVNFTNSGTSTLLDKLPFPKIPSVPNPQQNTLI